MSRTLDGWYPNGNVSKFLASSRQERRQRARARLAEVTDETAAAICEMLGDWQADAVQIGRRIAQGASALGGSRAALEGLLERLERVLHVPASRLRCTIDASSVGDICRGELSRRLQGCPFPVLVRLSRLAKADAMPWRRQDAIRRVLDAVVRDKLKGRRIDAAVEAGLADLSAPAAIRLVRPTWHLPQKPAARRPATSVAMQPAA